MTRNGKIMLEPIYAHLFEEHFCDANISDFKNCVKYITKYLYPAYKSLNKIDPIDKEFELIMKNYPIIDITNFKYPLIVIPRTIYIYMKLTQKMNLVLNCMI